MNLKEEDRELHSPLRIWQRYQRGEVIEFPEKVDEKADEVEVSIKKKGDKFLSALNRNKDVLILTAATIGATLGGIYYLYQQNNRFDYEDNGFRFRTDCEPNKILSDYKTHLVVSVSTNPQRLFDRDVILRRGDGSVDIHFSKRKTPFPGSWVVSYQKTKGEEVAPGQELVVEVIEADINALNKNEKNLASFPLRNPCG